MKKILLPSLLFFTTPLFAQNFQVGINGGLMQDGVHNNNITSYFVQDADRFQAHIITPDFSIKGLYRYKNYQLGIVADYRELTYKTQDYNPYSMIAFAGPIYRYTDRDIPVKIFLNRIVKIKHFETYGGLSAGYVFINSQRQIVTPPETSNVAAQHPNSVVAGIQLGATYFVTKRLGINMEIAGEYINYPASNDNLNNIPNNYSGYNVLDKGSFAIPATIGIRYRF